MLTTQRITGSSLLAAGALLGCGAAGPGFGAPKLTAPLVPETRQCGKIYPPARKTAIELPIKGAADYHNHQFSNLGFGGRVVWGDSFSREGGIEQALSVCGEEGACLDDDRELAVCKAGCTFAPNPQACRRACGNLSCEGSAPHGHLGVMDPVGAALEQGYGHAVSGYPDFHGWPHWNSYTHQQEYYRWLRRAFDGGLKLIVMLAVSNEVLCEFLGHVHACDDMTNVRRQLEAAYRLQALADYEQDCVEGNNDGWYRIAQSPAEARQIISEGAMAVVLGAEVDTLFNCYKNGSCTEAGVARMAKQYREAGLTHVFPVHLFDNAIGGTAAVGDFFNFGSAVVNHDLLHVRDCSLEGYEFQFGKPSGAANELISSLAIEFGVAYPRYADYKAHCNDRRLDPGIGRAAIKALIANKMIIDVDHMSTWTRKDVLDMIEACEYPGIVSGHSGFTALYHGEKKSEGQLTAREVERVLGLGGLLAPILHQGHTAELSAYKPKHVAGAEKGIASDCGNSAKSFAQAYYYAVDATITDANARKAERLAANVEVADKANQGVTDEARKMKRRDPVIGVGFGSDINGLAGLPTPRFGEHACGGDGAPQADPRVEYRFTALHGNGQEVSRMQIGTRVLDINEDGFANMGMFPDFVEELQKIGISPAGLDPLFNSAEAYVQMWERADAVDATKLPAGCK